MVSATNLAAGKESSGFLFGYFDSEGDNYANPIENKISVIANKKSDLALVELGQPNTAPDPNSKSDFYNEEQLNFQDQALIAGTSPVRKDPEENGGVVMYEVRPGDTVSSIAAKHNVTVNTILWANEMDNVNSIMPGDKLFILPVAGMSYVVKKNDDLDSIAQKYKADKGKIIAFNDLPANGELTEGETIVIPDGQKEVIRPAAPSADSGSAIASRPYQSFQSLGKILSGNPKAGHKFPYGYCTWYVAQRKYVPWAGNAGTWLYSAKALGYATGKSPRVGSIMVSSESWWGHVAIVEKIEGNLITVSEMNYKGWAKKSFRTLSANSRVIKGFIY